MQVDKLLFIWAPLRDASTSAKPRVRKAQFGDGYEQRSKDGINNDLRPHSLKFRYRDSIINQIEKFLEDRGGVESFLYSHKKAPVKLYVCEEWNRTDIDFNTSEISATFREVVN